MCIRDSSRTENTLEALRCSCDTLLTVFYPEKLFVYAVPIPFSWCQFHIEKLWNHQSHHIKNRLLPKFEIKAPNHPFLSCRKGLRACPLQYTDSKPFSPLKQFTLNIFFSLFGILHFAFFFPSIVILQSQLSLWKEPKSHLRPIPWKYSWWEPSCVRCW